MADRTVVLNVAGKSCRVRTTASDEELGRLTAVVEEKLRGVLKPGRPLTTEAMLLVAVALAHEVEAQRARADALAGKARDGLEQLLAQVDAVLTTQPAGTSRGKGGANGSSKARSSE